jgi:hypothetical protein
LIDFNAAPHQNIPRIGPKVEDVRERLRASPAAFIEWLFSGRAIIGKHEARIGNAAGEPGESLAIQLSGPKAGLWFDHATEESGDLIDLYRAYMGYTGGKEFALSLKEIAKDFFGDPVELQRPPWRPTPQQRIDEKKTKLGTKPPSHVLELGPPVESYGYYGRDGKVVCVMRRYEPGGVDERGKPNKTFRPSPPTFPTPRPLYRVPEIIQAPNVALVEGERCANALASVGIEATSAMGGANTKIEMVDWSPLAGKAVTIWPDNDSKGIEYAHKAAKVLLGIGCQVSLITPPKDKPLKWDAWDCLQEGGDLHAIYTTAKPYSTQDAPPPPLIPVLTMADLRKLPPHQWIVEGWMPTDSLGFVYGDPGCGKSFFVLDMCLHLAHGMSDWHGVSIKRHGAILYILQEGGRGIVDRVDAFNTHHGMAEDPPDFHVITTSLSFLDPDCIDALEAAVRAQGKEYRMIVVDTVSRVLPGADENLQKEMTVFIGACDRLRRVCGAAVTGVHHAGKSGDLRGSTVLRGAGDFVYKLEKERGVKPITLTCEKLKDEEDGWQKTLPLEKIELTQKRSGPGIDFNKQKTSLVITGMSSDEAAGSSPPREVCQRILDALAEAWESGHPWRSDPQTGDEYALRIISKRYEISTKAAKDLLARWVAYGVVAVDTVSSHSRKKGYKALKHSA